MRGGELKAFFTILSHNPSPIITLMLWIIFIWFYNNKANLDFWGILYITKWRRAGLRWQRSKKWCTPSPTNTSKKKLYVELFEWNIYWTLSENLTLPKRIRNPPHNWVEQMEEKEKKEVSGWEQHSWEGAMKEERNPHPGRSSNWQISQDTEGTPKPWRRAQQPDWDRQSRDRVLKKPSVPPPPQTPQPEMLGWGLGVRLYSGE